MTRTLTLSVPDMSCAHCKATIERAVAATDPAARLAVDLPAHRVAVETTIPAAAMIAALEAAGYPATEV